MCVCVCVHITFISIHFLYDDLLTLSSSDVADGAPLSELSWPSSLAVVAVSFSGLFTFIFLMIACLCCKKGDIGFKVSSLLPPAGISEEATGCAQRNKVLM